MALATVGFIILANKHAQKCHEEFKRLFGVSPVTEKTGIPGTQVVSARVLQVLKELACAVVSAQAEVYSLGVDVQNAVDKGMSADEALSLQTKAFELDSALRRAKAKLNAALALAKRFKIVDQKTTFDNLQPNHEEATA